MPDPTAPPAWAPLGAFSVLIVPPVEEPLTLEEGKLRAGLSWPTVVPEDPRDQLMRDHIAAARAQVEKDTELALLTQVRDLYFSATFDGQLASPGQSLPVQEVIDVWTVSGDGTVDPASAKDRIRLRWSRTPRALFQVGGDLPEDLGGLIVRAKVGWIDAKDLRAKEPGLLQAVGLLTAHYATTGRDAVVTGTIASEVPLGYEEVIARYRLVWVT